MITKKINIAWAILFLGFTSQAQLTIQSGATFTMQTGSQVTVQGSVDNAGSLANEGTLKVQGNYSSTGTYSATAGILEMYGTGNSNMNAGSSPIANLIINKTNETDVVKLTASAVVTNTLTHTNGVFTTDPLTNPSFNLSAPVNATFTFATGKEILGTVKRTSWTAGTARVFNNANMQVATNGGTTPTDLSVTMIPLSAGGDPSQSEREVKRKFNFNQTGGSGFTADVRFPYTATELNTNLESNLVPWSLVVAEWNARLSPLTRDVVNDYVSTTGITATALAQEWKLADPNYTMNIQASLRGSWNGTSMNTALNTILPLSQPYNDVAFGNYNGGESVAAGFFTSHPNIVDWVLIDFRKPISGLAADANSASAIARKAGFILNSGSIVELDGITPMILTLNKQGQGFATVRHRNHLGVMSPSKPLDAVGNFSNDFRVLANNYTNGLLTSPPAQLLAGGSYGLWAGNANKDGTVNAGDVALVKSNANITLTGYVFGDVNMDQTVNAGDVGITKISANSTAQTGSSRANSNRTVSVTEPQSHLPIN
jgi:hypothetical protein